ncbi:hypothetical protein BX666DRAFT_1987676 [Dichotomocladium elegans]|nr:hypothetical protein BX666DRAFT_1987676 [Dichotomocladium elegans]
MQNMSITSLLKMNPDTRTLAAVSPTNDVADPLFDDWLVQDALDEEDGRSSESSPSPSLPASSSPATVLLPPHHHQHPLQVHELAGLTAALVTLMKQSPTSTLTAPHVRSACQREPRSMSYEENDERGKKKNKRKRKADDDDNECEEEDGDDDDEQHGGDHDRLDQAALKRKKNTDAARRSRLKKALRMESLETRVADLEKTHQALLLRVAVLTSEKRGLASKEASYEDRIKVLEAQLAETHKALARKVAASKVETSDTDTDRTDADPKTDA